MNALDKAFADADRIRDLACKTAPTSASMLASGPGGGVSTTIPSLSKAAEQYHHGSKGWAYAAIRAISQRIAGQTIFCGRLGRTPNTTRKDASLVRSLPRAFKSVGDRLEPLGSHPFLSALDDPNPVQCRWQLLNSVVASLEMTGAGFLWWSGDGSIWVLPSHWIRPADTLNSAWIIRPNRQAQEFTVAGEDVAYFSLPNPADPFDSLSPLATQSHAIACDEQIQQAQYRAFRNGIFPSVMIKAGRLPGMLPGEQGEVPVLTAEQRRELITAIRSNYRGAANYGEPLIVDGLIEGVEKLSQSPEEMDFLNSSASVKSRILQSFGVNAIVLGEIQGANRASAVVAEESFCANVLNPLAEMFSQTLTRWGRIQFNDPNLVIWLDWFEAHDSEMELDRWKVAISAGYVTQNEFRTQLLNLPAVPGGDAFLDLLTGLPRGQSNDAG